jgi:transposase
MAKKLVRDLLKIGQWEPSTKTCRMCGRRREMPLNVRIFVCECCGHVEHRDLNASHNILEAGRRLRSGASSKTTHGWQDALSHGSVSFFVCGSVF